MKKILIVFCLFALYRTPLAASAPGDTSRPESRVVVPGPEYDASWLHRLIFGNQWRDLWTTPIRVNELDLDKFAGGLTPLKRGGGKQTRSLRFRGADGKTYKLRSLDKDPSQGLPPEFRESSVAVDFIQDQISSSNPMSAVLVSPILDAAGVLHSEPRIVALPNSPRLGKFQEEFGGMVGTLEEEPVESDDPDAGFAGADKIEKTYSLYQRLDLDNREQVDAGEFLKARLMDIYLGDWDRHQDQWRWAGYRKDGGGWTWKPIPRDRDWAFARFNGFVPWISSMMIPEFAGFGGGYTDVEEITWKGRNMDRRLLSSIGRESWDSVTALVVSRLTDSVIDYAVHQLPPEMYAKEGESITRDLRSRRTGLPAVSGNFYRLLNASPDVHASAAPEVVEVHRLDDHRVEVLISRRNAGTGLPEGAPFFTRTFSDDETREIRIYTGGGGDSVFIDGQVDGSMPVRLIGGEGRNAIVDQSRVGGHLLGILPISSASTKTILYDLQPASTVTAGPSTGIDETKWDPPADDSARYEPPRDYGRRWKFLVWFNANPDEGLFLGGGPRLYQYGFRTQPFDYRMDFRAGYAFGIRKFRIDYLFESYSWLQGALVSVEARASQLEFSNFFGLGNTTPFDNSLGYYRVEQHQVFVRPAIDAPLGDGQKLSLGLMVKYVDRDLVPGTYLSDSLPYGSEKNLTMGALTAGLTSDTRDDQRFATRGAYLQLSASYFPEMFNIDNHFGKLRAEARTYLSASVLTDATLALRVAGEKVWGKYPFFESAFIGGEPTVRGFERQRFAGDASLYGNAELRFFLTKFNFLVPGAMGLSVMGEGGRVYLQGESSNLWHTAVGGGIWLALIKSSFTVSISVARSSEKTGVYATSGFMY